MKKELLFLMFLVLLTPSYAILDSFGDLNIDYGYVHVTSIKYEPYPAEPGKYVNLWVKVQNAGPEKANIGFKLVPKYPFSLDAGEKAERNLPGILSGETTLVTYRVRVAIDAVEGRNELYYEATINGMKESSNFNIWVQTIDANIAVSSVKTQMLVPGASTPVEIELENMADSPMSNVRVKLDLTATTLPFVPVNSTTEKKLAFIEPGRKNSIIFDLMALPGATANAYKVPIEIKFTDGTGENYTKTSIIGLIVGAKPDLMITTSSSDIYAKGIGNIALKVTNKGLTDIKLVSANLKASNNYDVISESNLYLGNIDTDDYATADYRIKVKKITKGIVPLELELNYLDANNNKYSQIMPVELKVVSAKDLGISTNGGASKIFLLIIIIGAGYYYYRKWERKKLAKK